MSSVGEVGTMGNFLVFHISVVFVSIFLSFYFLHFTTLCKAMFAHFCLGTSGILQHGAIVGRPLLSSLNFTKKSSKQSYITFSDPIANLEMNISKFKSLIL